MGVKLKLITLSVQAEEAFTPSRSLYQDQHGFETSLKHVFSLNGQGTKRESKNYQKAPYLFLF